MRSLLVASSSPRVFPPVPGAPLLYSLGRSFFQVAFFFCIKTEIINASEADREGGYLLACTHLSHLESVCASVLVGRKIDWMARREFFRFRPIACLLRAIDAFPIYRQGVPVRAIRTATERARQGRVIGVFPEGGVAIGADSACRGGKIKPGACLISMASGRPIIPVVILGTHRLNRVLPWIPIGRRERIWVIFGRPLSPPENVLGRGNATLRRRRRNAMNDQLRERFAEMYAELRDKYAIDDRAIP